MALKTCFLPHFPRSLQGRAKRSEASRLASGLHDLRQLALPDLASLLAAFLPEDFFAKAPGAKARRVRLLPPATVFWAFLYQALNPDMACQEVVSKLCCWRLSQRQGKEAKSGKPSMGTSGYCQSRKALGLNLVVSAFENVRSHLERRAASAWLWCGRRVKDLDGTSFSMPDTAANQKRWPQHSSQKKGCGFATAKMLGLFCLSTGTWLGHSLGRWCRHDLSLLAGLKPLLVKTDILLGDAGFCSYALMAVFRLHQARSKDMRRGRRLGTDNRLQTWTKPVRQPPRSSWKKRAWNKLPQELPERM